MIDAIEGAMSLDQGTLEHERSVIAEPNSSCGTSAMVPGDCEEDVFGALVRRTLVPEGAAPTVPATPEALSS